jgi:fucose 4-O-acetylase-like acetyltransferase
MNKNRIVWIDIAKGIGIITVILGHMSIPNILQRYIFSFHMPLFFFLSGYLFSQQSMSTLNYIKKRIRTILLPYVLFSIIIIIIWAIVNISTRDIIPSLYSTLIGNGAGNGFWFLICLFITEVVFFILQRYIKNKLTLSILILFSGGIGYLFSVYNIHLIWKVDVMFTSLVFLYSGYHAKKYNILEPINRMKKLLLISICFFLSIIFCFINHKGNIGHVDMNSNYYGNILFFYISAFSGILFIKFIAQYLEHSKTLINNALIYLGRNTLILLMLQGTLPQLLQKFVQIIFNISQNVINTSPILKYSCRIISLGLLIVFVQIINNYCPYLIGKQKVKHSESLILHKN